MTASAFACHSGVLPTANPRDLAQGSLWDAGLGYGSGMSATLTGGDRKSKSPDITLAEPPAGKTRPGLERTHRKLQARAQAIIDNRPELEFYFDDLSSTDAAGGADRRETSLIAALDAHVAVRIQAERLIAAYIAPESDRAAIINELITLFDGPEQREAQQLATEALNMAGERVGWHAS
jgi:hypothetical protein